MPNTSESLRRETRDAQLSANPNPWEAVVRLEYGGDRTFAHVIENRILAATPADFAVLEKCLLDLLATPGITLAGKDFTCRMLAIAGSDAAIPALTPLLKKPETEHLARMALESIATPKAAEALRQTAKNKNSAKPLA